VIGPVLILLLVSGILGGETIRGELWVRSDLVDMASPGDAWNPADEPLERYREAIDRMLEDARWIVSGMIYGFDVVWTPSARGRGVAELWEIQPVAQIPRGDPRLHIVSTVEEDGFLYVLLEYRPDDTQSRRLAGWAGQAHPGASGLGEASIWEENPRRAALEAAIRATLRSWLRAREYNRPQEVRGRVALTDFPVTGLSGGSLNASVRLRIDLEAVEPYRID